MKLPTDFPKLDSQLKELGIKYKPFMRHEIEKALARTGVTVTSDEIVVASNGTVEYQGQKVILYIRDIIGYLPKYHVVDCITLKDMRSRGKAKRYVVTRRTDGEFLLNFADNLSRDDPETDRLDICKNCLGQLELRDVYEVNAFPIADWLNAIDRNYEPPPTDGLYGPMTAPVEGPISNYPPNWNLLSLQCRQRAEWQCEACGIDLNLKFDRKFLHAHHLRGTKYNQPEDLKALCIGCHAEQLRHEHMRALPDYSEFMKKYGDVWEARDLL